MEQEGIDCVLLLRTGRGLFHVLNWQSIFNCLQLRLQIVDFLLERAQVRVQVGVEVIH